MNEENIVNKDSINLNDGNIDNDTDNFSKSNETEEIEKSKDIADNKTIAPKNKIEYTFSDCFFAFSAILLGYLFVKLILAGGLGFGSAIFYALFLTLVVIYFKINRVRFKAVHFLQTVAGYLGSFYFALSDNSYLKFLDLIFCALIILHLCYSVCHQKREREKLPGDMLNSVLIMPFSCGGDCHKAVRSAVSKSTFGKNIKYIIVGLVVAIPLFAIVLNLLMSADIMFRKMMDGVFTDILSDTFVLFLQLIIGLPVAFLIFGAMLGNLKRGEKAASNEAISQFSSSFRVFPPLVMYSAVVPICLIYILFFVSQTGYFLSAFSSSLPESFSYAQYARQGFFELCAVASINLCILIAMRSLTKLHKNELPAPVKFFSMMLSVMTLMLISTALAKMLMYIENYGLTPLRVYTSWFMAILAILFICIIIREICPKFKLFATYSVIFCVMFLSLLYCDCDALIAKVNIDRYNSGQSEELDVAAICSLSASAVPYLAEIDDKFETERFVNRMSYEAMNLDWRSKSIASLIAEKYYTK